MPLLHSRFPPQHSTVCIVLPQSAETSLRRIREKTVNSYFDRTNQIKTKHSHKPQEHFPRRGEAVIATKLGLCYMGQNFDV